MKPSPATSDSISFPVNCHFSIEAFLSFVLRTSLKIYQYIFADNEKLQNCNNLPFLQRNDGFAVIAVRFCFSIKSHRCVVIVLLIIDDK